jgi:hypothetical protein
MGHRNRGTLMPQPLRNGDLIIVLGGFKTEAEAIEWATDPKTTKLKTGLVVKRYGVRQVPQEPGWEKTEGASVWRESTDD